MCDYQKCVHISTNFGHFVQTHQIHFLLLRLPSTEEKKTFRVTKLRGRAVGEIALEDRGSHLGFTTEGTIRPLEEQTTPAVLNSNYFFYYSTGTSFLSSTEQCMNEPLKLLLYSMMKQKQSNIKGS